MDTEQGILHSAGGGTRRQTRKNNNARDNRDKNDNNVIVVSVVENRAREVCICKIDNQEGSTLAIYLLSDSHSYNETVLTLQSIQPNEILLHDGARNRTLSKKIELECSEDTRVLYISRLYFDQDRGADLLKNVLVGEVDADLVAKYIVLSGAFCLLRYLDNCSGDSYAPHSMRLEYMSSSGTPLGIGQAN